MISAVPSRSAPDECVAKDVRWELHEGPETSKRAAWLVLRKGGADGQLTLATSGELELEWGTSAADTHCEYHEVMDSGELGHCVAFWQPGCSRAPS